MQEYKYILTYYPLTGGSSSLDLEVNPIKWNDLATILGRDEIYHGVQSQYTIGLQFTNLTNGGYSFIKQAFDFDDIQTNISCEIKKRNPQTNDYDSRYIGKLDFTPGTFTFNDYDGFIEIKMLAGDKLQKFIDRDENNINLKSSKSIENVTISTCPQVSSRLSPVDITAITRGTSEINESADYGPGDDITWYNYYKNATYNRHESSEFIIDNIDRIYTNTYLTNVIINLKFGGEYDFNIGVRDVMIGSLNTNVKIYNGSDELQNTYNLYTIDSIIAGDEFENYEWASPYGIQEDIILEPNWYIIVEQVLALRNPAFSTIRAIWSIQDNNYFDITEKVIGLPSTDSYSYQIHEAVDSILKNILDVNTSQLKSNILGRTNIGYSANGELSDFTLQNGFQIRNYPASTVDLKFADTFKSLFALRPIGLWYNPTLDKFELEEIEYFYTDSLLLDLGEVSNFQVKSNPKAYFNKINAGFENEGDYERVQGANEFAVKREYSSIAKCKEEYSIRCPFRMDSVGIEEIRNNQYITTGSADVDGDQDIFLIQSVLSGGKYIPVIPTNTYFPLDAKGYEIFKTYYNLFYTPRQNAVRHNLMIRLAHFKNDYPLKAQKTTKSFELQFTSEKVDENSDLLLTPFDAILYLPLIYTFESYLTDEQFEIIRNNPHGYFKLYNNSKRYDGYIKKIERNDYTGKSNFELIAKDNSTIYLTFENGNRIMLENGNKLIKE